MTQRAMSLAVDIAVTRESFDVRAAFEVPDRRVLGIVGPNGAGKSSILAAIAGLVDATGSVRLGEADLHARPAELRGIGLVFQDFLLFPHLTVRDNVAFPARVRGGGWSAAREEAGPCLERFDLVALADRYPGTLSGGQAQRVALARALASQPAVLMLDEPMAALDVEVRAEVRSDLLAYVREFGGPTIVVSHDVADAAALADEIAVIEQGRIVQQGSLGDLAAAPATSWVRRFFG
jgi:molybdate transport system ATP-binding protein